VGQVEVEEVRGVVGVWWSSKWLRRVIGEIERVEERALYGCVDVILFKSTSLSW